MGKARTPGAPWYLQPLALLIAGVLLCVVGVCYGPKLAGRQAEAQRAGQVARRGCPLALGQTWCATPCSGTRPGLPCPGPTLPGAEAPWGRACLPGPGPVQAQGRSSACSPTGTTTTSPWPWTRTWTPWSATTAGRGSPSPA